MAFDDLLPALVLACIGANFAHAIRRRSTKGVPRRRRQDESLYPSYMAGRTRAVREVDAVAA
jgi:hypothetical protein